MENYSVKNLSELAGISVRTLHYYDQIDLLKPSIRTEAKYRFYGKKELLRLQQILFFKELGFSLKEICKIMDNPEFDLLLALSNHKVELKKRRDRIETLIDTIDKTIFNQFKKKMLKPEELYVGLSKETAETYRAEAIKTYGAKAVETSEKSLLKLTKEQIVNLREEQIKITHQLSSLMNESYDSDKVQNVIAKHYVVTRKFWGTHNSKDPESEKYLGLGELFTTDERFTEIEGNPQPELAKFMNNAMSYFAKNKLG
ncbi:MerR family transcriptional regulator [Aquimarina macrocephali]|uniref:MerR family transcriptional regulator n=1 Tax=Aquimarina macrocephali TaxID=666563 RepID=UPI000467C083|nr:MerR family transcriptional regulator [Aquimarina macrocephali]